MFNNADKLLKEYKANPTEELKHKYELYSDVHKANASLCFQKPISQVTKLERQRSKSLNFGVLYDESPMQVAEELNLSLEEVEKMFRIYYQNIPSIIEWKRKIKYFAQTHGYAECLQGRRRRLPIFKMHESKENLNTKEERAAWGDATRQASNAPIQGIASDACLIASSLFNNYIMDSNKNWKIVNCVHDSCLWECPLGEVGESLEAAEHIFTDGLMEYMTRNFGIEFNLPLDVDFAIGGVNGNTKYRWGELMDWDRSPQALQEIMKKLKGEV